MSVLTIFVTYCGRERKTNGKRNKGQFGADAMWGGGVFRSRKVLEVESVENVIMRDGPNLSSIFIATNVPTKRRHAERLIWRSDYVLP